MISPLYFTTSPANQTGFIYSTNFVFVASIPTNFVSLVWDFGDNTSSYNSLTAQHLYNYPGIYTVSLSAYYSNGSVVTNSGEIAVDYAIRDSIEIVSSPTSYGTASVMPTQAFTLAVTSCQINSELDLVLQSINSESLPHYAVNYKNKWNFLATDNDFYIYWFYFETFYFFPSVFSSYMNNNLNLYFRKLIG